MKLQDAARIADDVLIDLDLASLRNRLSWERFAFKPILTKPGRPPTAAGLKRLSDAERDELNKARIRYHGSRRVLVTSSANRFLQEARDLLVANEDETSAAPGLLLTGRFNSGKTTLATHFGREYHVSAVGTPGARVALTFDEGHAPHVPVVYLKITDGMTTKQANQAIASFFDVETGDASRYDITAAMSRIMEACRTRLVICDDVHRLASPKNQVAGYLKDLADILPVTLIFIHGKPASIDALGDEILERFTEYKFGPVPKESSEWKKLLGVAEGWMDLYNQQPGDLTGIADYLWDRTQGFVSVICPLLRKAATRAIREGGERVDRELIESTRLPKRSEEREQKAKDKADALDAVRAVPDAAKAKQRKRGNGRPARATS